MSRERIGQVVFALAVFVAVALYSLTAPEGLPWNESVRLAAEHSLWGFYVRVFGGPVTLSSALAALAAGLLASVLNRHLGWRVAASAALVWTFLPWVWNRAITGERSVCLAALAVALVWTAHVVALWVLRKARAMRMATQVGRPAAALPRGAGGRINRLAGWVALGLAGLFAVVSASFHDYRLGEVASVYARGVVRDAGDRIIVLNGICDEQIEREVEKVGGGGWRSELAVVRLNGDEGYRRELASTVKRLWSDETNLWAAAEVGTKAFLDVALARHPDWFYRLDGASTTLEGWERRWAEFTPYLGSSDPFVTAGRRLFGYEGNLLASRLQDKAAWALLRRVCEEVDPGNISALVNMSEMMRRGFPAGVQERKAVQAGLDAFFHDVQKSRHAREIVRLSGPIRSDPELLAKLADEAKRRIAERIAAGEKLEVSPEVMTFVEWNNAMVGSAEKGDFVEAGRLARKILSHSPWRGAPAANAILATALAKEGNRAESVVFFKAAIGTTNDVPAVVLNDYADTLMCLGKLDEAETIARRAVAKSDETYWLARLTLAEILEDRVGRLVLAEVVEDGVTVERYVKIEGADAIEEEIRGLFRDVLRYAPENVRIRVRQDHRRYAL